jgi:hypothetical protein
MRSSESIGLLNICFYSALLRCAITRTGERLLPYSKPTTGSSWLDPFKRERQIHLETILTYMDEIHRHGGQAWAFTDKFALLEAMIGERFATLIDARNGGKRGTCEASLRQLVLRCPSLAFANTCAFVTCARNCALLSARVESVIQEAREDLPETLVILANDGLRVSF